MMTFDLYKGDCLELMNNIAAKSIDMVLVDLPYGTTHNKWDTIIPFDALWGGFNRIIKDNGVIALFAQQPFASKLVMSNPKMFRYEWCWEKNNPTGFLDAHSKPLRSHENILIFYKHLPVYNPQKTYGHKPYKARATAHSSNYAKQSNLVTTANTDGSRYPRDVIRGFSQERGLHPTQKPVDLLEYFIRTYTNEGDMVLDCCMGSGSTGVACINTNRNFIGMELNDDYYNIAKERIEKAYGLR